MWYIHRNRTIHFLFVRNFPLYSKKIIYLKIAEFEGEGYKLLTPILPSHYLNYKSDMGIIRHRKCRRTNPCFQMFKIIEFEKKS